jgi:NAD(P)-dependent dehydrogenase (short-subunit alcohol dehydrogenase family)
VALARHGAKVIVTARDAEKIRAVAREIVSGGGDALALPADITREHDVCRLFEHAGQVDILVNNAGIIQPIALAASADIDAWFENIAINLGAVFLTCRFALPGMLERGWGRIVNVSSGAAKGTTMGWSAYAAAKAGVEALTKSIAVENGDKGIRANAVRPGIVETDMQAEIRQSTEEDFGRANVERFRSYKERGILREPEDPAKLILWLLSPEAENLNGEVLAIDDPEVAAKIGLEPRGR